MSRRLHDAVRGQLCLLELLDRVAASRVDVDEGVRLGGRSGLGKWDRAVLAFAAEYHLSPGGLARVRQRLRCSPARYLQALSGLLDNSEVLAAHPDLAGHLLALRNRRRRLREASRTEETATPGPGPEGES